MAFNTCDSTIALDLQEEVDRIITSPYPVSLKSLHCLVADADVQLLQTWACNNPCQLSRLAVAVCEALALWPFSLDLLRKLLCSGSFRETVLKLNPTLLAAFVQKAVSSPPDFDRYSDICILFLSEILPPSVALPAPAQDFFLQVFDNLAKSPIFENLQRAHTLALGACSSLFALLPTNAVAQFERNVKCVLQTKKPPTPENRQFDLFSVDLLCLLSRHTVVSRVTETTLFQGANALKQIDLINSNMIDACKGDECHTSDAVARIKAARRVIETIGEVRVMEWKTHRTQTGDHILSKLLQRASKPTLDASIQGEAFAYISCLMDAPNLPSVLCDSIRNLFGRLTTSSATSFPWLHQVLAVYSGLLDESSTQALISGVMNVITNPSTPIDLSRVRSLAKVLAEVLHHYPVMSGWIVSFIGSIKSEQEADGLTKMLSGVQSSSHETKGACSSTRAELHRLAVLNINTLFLKARLYSSRNEANTRQEIWSKLLDLQERLGSIHFSCPHSIVPQQRQMKSLCIMEQECTQLDLQDEDWRSKIARELENHHTAQQKSVIQTVTQMCRDLEQRCELSEQPLRQEQAHSRELSGKCDALQFRLGTLGVEVNDKTFVITGLEHELGEAETAMRELASEKESLSVTISSLQEQLKELDEARHENLQAARKAFDVELMELRSTLSSKEDLIHEQMIRIEDLDKIILDDKVAANQLQADHDEQLRFGEATREELGQARRDLQHVLACGAQKDEHIATLQQREQALVNELDALRYNLGKANAEAEELRDHSKHQAILSKEAMAHVAAEFRQKELDFEGHIEEMDSRLYRKDQELEGSTAELELTKRNLSRAIKQHSSQIDDLKLQIEELNEICSSRETELDDLRLQLEELTEAYSSKESEISQYKTWQQQLVSMMPGVQGEPGTSGEVITAKTKQLKRTSRSTPVKVARRSARVQEASQHTDMNTSFGSSSSKDESTPKRARPRKSFRVPLLRLQHPVTPRVRKSLQNEARRCEIYEDPAEISPSEPLLSVHQRGLTSTQPARLGSNMPLRPALFDVSGGRGNISPIRADSRSVKQPIKRSVSEDAGIQLRNMLPTMEITSFDASNVFTSTPLTPHVDKDALNDGAVQQDNETVDIDEL